MAFTALLDNGFQQQKFLYSRAHDLAGWRPSHTNFLLFSLPSKDFLFMATGHRYIASVRTAQKIALSAVTPL
jgi:hypothetical protein